MLRALREQKEATSESEGDFDRVAPVKKGKGRQKKKAVVSVDSDEEKETFQFEGGPAEILRRFPPPLPLDLIAQEEDPDVEIFDQIQRDQQFPLPARNLIPRRPVQPVKELPFALIYDVQQSRYQLPIHPRLLPKEAEETDINMDSWHLYSRVLLEKGPIGFLLESQFPKDAGAFIGKFHPLFGRDLDASDIPDDAEARIYIKGEQGGYVRGGVLDLEGKEGTWKLKFDSQGSPAFLPRTGLRLQHRVSP